MGSCPPLSGKDSGLDVSGAGNQLSRGSARPFTGALALTSGTSLLAMLMDSSDPLDVTASASNDEHRAMCAAAGLGTHGYEQALASRLLHHHKRGGRASLGK